MQMEAFIKAGENQVSIGNGYITRVFEMAKDGSFRTAFIRNRRLEEEADLVFGACSEEFVLRFMNGRKKVATLKASMLRVADILTNEADGTKRLEVRFAPYKALGITYTVSLFYEVTDDKPYLYKTLRLASSDSSVKLDSIDTEFISLPRDLKQKWSRPDMDEAYLSKFHSALGQPFYLNGMYFGNEFPANDNNIEDGIAHITYYSGKALQDIYTENGAYCTWKTVVGAARSLDYEVIRADFLDYIRDISQPIYLRTQYNSWFDHMLNINKDNIRDSFFEIEKGLTETRVAPLHSYVVDDGWNDYSQPFWCFNEKFPNELYESSALAKHFASDFGLWLGPRGGYDDKTYPFAKHMQRAKMGGANRQARDVCTADHRYIQELSELFLDYMKRFDINYWKLDGFLLKSCHSKKHGHPTGGYRDIYCFTDHWENWTRLLKEMRDARTKEGKSLWINQTSYCNASPWYLQFSESLWLQNCTDIGFLDKTDGGEEMKGADFDRMLSYRDDRYFDFLETRAYQFPLSNIYNHEPIYGNTAKIKMTDDEFRKYLYMIATRGTAFWELYYSFNMFNKAKWRINADVLKFLQENFHILRNAKLLGKSPKTGSPYGYSAWDGAEGILSVRNPLNKPQTFSVTLDRLIGVAEDADDLTCAVILPYTESAEEKHYTYGDTVTVELEPHEVRILRFGKADSSAPVLEHVNTLDDRHVLLSFDKHVVPVNFPDGYTYEILENYSDILVTLPEALKPATAQEAFDQTFTAQIRDVYGNESTITATACYHVDHKLETEMVLGTEDFTVHMCVENAPKDCILWTQGSDLSATLQNGKLVFNCKGLKVRSDDTVAEHAARVDLVREKNGMLKIYVDGTLSGGAYDEKHLFEDLASGEMKKHDSVTDFTVYDCARSFDEIK